MWKWHRIKAFGLAICLVLGLLVLVGLVQPFHIVRTPGGLLIRVLRGGLNVISLSWDREALDALQPRWEGPALLPGGGPVHWWPSGGVSRWNWWVLIPVWMPLAVAALPTAYAWHRCRRRPPGHCPRCGYDLAGITTRACPECGKAVVP